MSSSIFQWCVSMLLQLVLLQCTRRKTRQAGLQIEGLAADHIQVRLEHVRIVQTALDYVGPCQGALPVPPARCNGSASLSPIVLGDPEHGNILVRQIVVALLCSVFKTQCDC